MLGSNQESMITGQFPLIPQRYQAAMRHGVRFFECHFPRPSLFNTTLFGPYDIIVEEEVIPGSLHSRFASKLLVGKDAQVRYETVNNNGLAIAFICDDKYWHNRVMIADSNEFRIAHLHTRDGLIPGSIAKLEIDCLREVITEDVTIWKIMDGTGKERGMCWTEFDANIEMTTARKEKGWHIELGKKRRKTTFIRELIKKYRNALYGWTNCDEFRNEIIPNVTALVEERRNKHVVDGQVGGNVGDLSGMIKRAIMELPVDTLRELISQKVAVETAVTKNEQPQEESQAEQVGPTVPTYSKESLVVMTKAQLREIAGTYNIATSATSKNADLVNAILEAQGAAPSQGVDESYDDLPTEEEMVIR